MVAFKTFFEAYCVDLSCCNFGMGS